MVNTATKYFAVSKLTTPTASEFPLLSKSLSLLERKKCVKKVHSRVSHANKNVTDLDKVPVEFPKTPKLLINFYQLLRIHIGARCNAHDEPKPPTYPIKRNLDHSFLIKYTPKISKREIYSSDRKIIFYPRNK